MKKNQFALIFLTLIVMLAVWYIKTPKTTTEEGVNGDNLTIPTSGRLDAIESLREAVNDERNKAVADLDAIIASADTSVIEKENALSEKQVLSDLTEKEVILEAAIINMGYSDAFVHSTDSGVEVIIVSDTEDSGVALDIINEVLATFDSTTNVVVNFKSEMDLIRS